MKNIDVATLFLGKNDCRGSNLYSINGKLYSYDTVIAQWDGIDLIGNSTKYSCSTSRHLGYIKNRIDIWTTKPVPINTRDLRPYL